MGSTLIRQSASSGSGGGLIKTPFTPIYTASTSGNWNTTPTSLMNAVDGNSGTSTTEGLATGSNGARGYIQYLFGSVYINAYIEYKLGVRKQSGQSYQRGCWGVQISQDAVNWSDVGGIVNSAQIPDTEIIFLGVACGLNGLKGIRFWAEDIGSYGGHLKIYEINCFQLS